MKTGDLVKVKTFAEGVVERRVVEIVRNTVYICTENEWRTSAAEGRKPDCAGFKREYVIGKAEAAET
jgi:hypothetical protein